MTGRISSFQSLGAVDGPGIRFVVFFKGCPLNCLCCHNPETKAFEGGEQYTAEEIVEKALRYKEYFGNKGGITLSGGEPIAQPEFACEIFKLAKEKGIHTCLDTSGYTLNEDIKELLEYTDLVLLDIKYTNTEDYRKNVGAELSEVLRFLDYLKSKKISTWIRQVIIPTLNDNEDNILKLKEIIKKYPNIEKTELLPFKKLCQTKYDNLRIEFPLKDTPEPSSERMKELNSIMEKS
ncbi:MAG: pyruvate formate lyase-activating protein [Clostridia bacterium]|nr:pyruvate formate lyase-activating protein [Clostridia bacterium]